MTQPGNGMAWQKAVKLAEDHVKAHDGAFPSIKRLAKIVGCSRPTIDKAINNSPYLKARKAEKAKTLRSVPLTDTSIEQASEQAWRDDKLAKLIEEQKADQDRDDRQENAAKKHRT
jgi:predicted secreted protein